MTIRPNRAFQIFGQAQDGHDLRRHRNGKGILTGETADFAAQSYHHIPQGTVIHIHDPAPGDLPGIQPQFIAMVDMVVDHS